MANIKIPLVYAPKPRLALASDDVDIAVASGLPLLLVRNTAHWISCGIDGVATA